MHQQSLIGEHQKSLTQRHPAHTEPLGQLFLPQLLTGQKFTEENESA
jgi:hypothetical protein